MIGEQRTTLSMIIMGEKYDDRLFLVRSWCWYRHSNSLDNNIVYGVAVVCMDMYGRREEMVAKMER